MVTLLNLLGVMEKIAERYNNLDDILFFMKKVVCLVGMPGSGKSSVAKIFEENGYFIVRTGDITDDEVKKRGLEFTEENEKKIREELRVKYGKDFYAQMSVKKFQGDKIVIDGVYNKEEWEYWKREFNATLIEVRADAEIRYNRLESRKVRPLTVEEGRSRDKAHLENTGIGEAIEAADSVIENTGNIEKLKTIVEDLIKKQVF